MKERIPDCALEAVRRLERAGFSACFVGGCVRDLCLGRHINDWDIATSASCAQVTRLFAHVIPTGEKYGTVTVIMDEMPLEITTFRVDGGYDGHRRPQQVTFVEDVAADLARRDFTMNAIALRADGGIADPFGGLQDIEHRLIRCVGEPYRRFEEDALRMFRALRFAAVLGFRIEAETWAAIQCCADLAGALSGERVAAETEKMLLSPRPELLGRAVEIGLFAGFGVEKCAVNTSGLQNVPCSISMRWCAFCAALLKNGAISKAGAFLSALRRSRRLTDAAGGGAGLMMAGIPSDVPGLKHCLRRYGSETVRCAAAAQDALLGTDCLSTVERVLESGECWQLRDLAVAGADLLAAGVSPGRRMGEILQMLLRHVIECPADNTRTALLHMALEEESRRQ